MREVREYLYCTVKKRNVQICAIIICLLSALTQNVSARMSSATYQINADIISAGGTLGTSTHYTLNDTVAETSAVGLGSSTNYILKDGFWHMVNTYVHFSVDSTLVDLGTLTPGAPVTGQNTLSVTTDAWNGYTLSIEKNHKLLHANNIDQIQDHNGAITTPLTWSSPNDQGLGFSVISGTNVDAKWGSGTKFAAIPDTTTVFHEKTGYKSSADLTTIGYKIDVPVTQRSGDYSAIVTYTVISSL